MHIEVFRFSTSSNSTMGALQINGHFQCYTIEDGWHFEKVDGETRIPAGTYEIRLRREGGMTKTYGTRYPEMHRGMIWLQGVPGFEWVYIHTGNKAVHTEGCILVGDLPNNNTLGDGFCGSSGNAYKRIYPAIADAIESGDAVQITLRDIG
jgi:hypothetical protein